MVSPAVIISSVVGVFFIWILWRSFRNHLFSRDIWVGSKLPGIKLKQKERGLDIGLDQLVIPGTVCKIDTSNVKFYYTTGEVTDDLPVYPGNILVCTKPEVKMQISYGKLLVVKDRLGNYILMECVGFEPYENGEIRTVDVRLKDGGRIFTNVGFMYVKGIVEFSFEYNKFND